MAPGRLKIYLFPRCINDHRHAGSGHKEVVLRLLAVTELDGVSRPVHRESVPSRIGSRGREHAGNRPCHAGKPRQGVSCAGFGVAEGIYFVLRYHMNPAVPRVGVQVSLHRACAPRRVRARLGRCDVMGVALVIHVAGKIALDGVRLCLRPKMGIGTVKGKRQQFIAAFCGIHRHKAILLGKSLVGKPRFLLLCP